MLGQIVEHCRAQRPLVHCITNYVTANDCANLLLACGGSAVMADDPEEAAQIVSLCAGLVLNMGTPNPRKLEAMRIAGRRANAVNRPVVLDPVGLGCSQMRKEAAQRLLAEVRFAVIRGNGSEISALARGTRAHRGVDADDALAGDAAADARALALATGAAVVSTGKTDIVTDGRRLWRVHNGHAMMAAVTGSGCQLSALTGAYAAACPEQTAEAALAAVCAMGLCGETAHARLEPEDGNATYRNYIIDAMYRLTPEGLERGAKYELDE